MESMTRLEHVLDHSKLCDFSPKHIRNFQFQLIMFNMLTWVFWKQTQSIWKRHPYLEAALQSAPWPMPGLTSCVLWTGGFLRTFPPPVTRGSSPLRRASPRSPAAADVLHCDGRDTKEVLGLAKVDHGSDVGQRPSYRSLAYPSFSKLKDDLPCTKGPSCKFSFST